MSSAPGRTERSRDLGARGRLLWAFLALAAACFLWAEYRAHVIEYLPWAILALCPLMNLVMHRGHRYAGHEEHERSDRASQASASGWEP